MRRVRTGPPRRKLRPAAAPVSAPPSRTPITETVPVEYSAKMARVKRGSLVQCSDELTAPGQVVDLRQRLDEHVLPLARGDRGHTQQPGRLPLPPCERCGVRTGDDGVDPPRVESVLRPDISRRPAAGCHHRVHRAQRLPLPRLQVRRDVRGEPCLVASGRCTSTARRSRRPGDDDLGHPACDESVEEYERVVRQLLECARQFLPGRRRGPRAAAGECHLVNRRPCAGSSRHTRRS